MSKPWTIDPPQTIISVFVHMAECQNRGSGAPTGLVGFQASVIGSYRPPVFILPKSGCFPPHTIISLPLQIAVKPYRASGTWAVLVAIQLSVLGSYRPPVFK